MAKSNEKNDSKPLAIDLFCGCGGVTAGLIEAGFNVVSAIEIDKKAAETYRANYPSVSLLEKDIREVNVFALAESLNIAPGELHLLAGCPPCQGFSRIRKLNKARPAIDERNALIEEFERFVVGLKPKRVMLENVPGLVTHYRFQKFVSRLRRDGYFVTYQVVDVSDYGVPQRRKRLILTASVDGVAALPAIVGRKVTVEDAISHLLPPGKSGDELHDIPENRSEKVKEIIRNIPKNGGSRADLPERLVLECHKQTNGFSDVYGRMRWDDVAPTITSGCHNPSKGRFLHPLADRTISLREAAILQGFPEDYKFIVSHGKESIALMIGNALPPIFIKAHAEAIAATL